MTLFQVVSGGRQRQIPPSGFWPCVKSCLVGGSDKYRPADFLETYVWHKTLLSNSSHNPAYVPEPTFGFVKLLASSGSHCTKWAHEQNRPAGFESRLVPSLPLPFIPTLIGLRAFDLVSRRVWWEAATNKQLGWGGGSAADVGESQISPWSFYDWRLISNSCLWRLLKVSTEVDVPIPAADDAGRLPASQLKSPFQGYSESLSKHLLRRHNAADTTTSLSI